MSYTNALLQGMIDEYGERLCAITFDNAHTIHIGIQNGDGTMRPPATPADLQLVTRDGVDLVGVFIPSLSSTKARELGSGTWAWHSTALIQFVATRNDISMQINDKPNQSRFF